jgi:prepilin-type N-terminal cleavage/methylation domain-containing protein
MTTLRDEIRNDSGFTLIEVTAGLFILSLVLLLALQIFALAFRSAAAVRGVAAHTEALADMDDIVARIVLQADLPNATDRGDISEIAGSAERLTLSGPEPAASLMPGSYRMTLLLLHQGNDLNLMLTATLRSANKTAPFSVAIAHFTNVRDAAFGYLPAEAHSHFELRWPFGAVPLSAVRIVIRYRDGTRSVQAVFPTVRGV